MSDPAIKVKIGKPAKARLTLEPEPILAMRTDYVPIVPDYTGAYEADALFSRQTFPTADKRMRSDFTVNAINYTEADNPSGGKTLTIGG